MLMSQDSRRFCVDLKSAFVLRAGTMEKWPYWEQCRALVCLGSADLPKGEGRSLEHTF